MNQIKILLLSIVSVALLSCSKQTFIADIDTSYYRINKRNASNEKIDAMIDPYKVQLDAQMNEVIAFNEEELIKARPNSGLGNWFADVLHAVGEEKYGQVDFALQNYGGIRVPSLKQGDITVGNIYELMPFDNKLLLLTLDKLTLQKLLDRIAVKGGWPISHGLTFSINNGKASNILVAGEDIKDRNYRVIIPDYIANGGDQCDFLINKPREDIDLLLRDAVIDYLKEKPKDSNTLEVNKTNRIGTFRR